MGLAMTSDDFHIAELPLEAPRRRRWRRGALAAGLTALISAPGFFLLAHDVEARRSASDAFWRVEGPPCAPLSEARFRDVLRPPSVTPYDGAVYERHGGAMTCTHRTDPIDGAPVRYAVCKFDAPDYLAVTAGGEAWFYDLTMGRAASVGVVNGKIRCVVAPKFEM